MENNLLYVIKFLDTGSQTWRRVRHDNLTKEEMLSVLSEIVELDWMCGISGKEYKIELLPKGI